MSRNLQDREVKAALAASLKKQQELLDAAKARAILAQISQQLQGSQVHRTLIVTRKNKE